MDIRKGNALSSATRVAALLAVIAASACNDGPDGTVYPPATRVFIAGAEDSQVHVFDFETLDAVASIDVAAGPGEIHSTSDGGAIWTLARNGAAVAILDPETLTVRHEVRVGAQPVHSFLQPDEARIWVGNDGSADVSVIDLATGAEQRVLTGNGHHKMALVPGADGALAFVYVSNITDGTITVLDPTPALVTQIPVGPSPHGMDYSAHTRRVYNCAGGESPSIEVLDPFGASPHTIVSHIALPARCGYLHVEDGGRYAWATLGGAGLLARVDLAAETLETWPAGASPDKFAIVEDRAFVANVTEPTVTVIDLDDRDTRTIAIGEAHRHDGHGHRGMRRFGDRIFVPNEHDGTVSVIDVATETVIGTLTGIVAPSGIAIAGPGAGTPYPR